ncbi:uncharacterized protein LOC126802288 [Argentina anserina]|uniref:uncharacterized protein LOC126802288 n=1 Tax=Argentina anserina TaxID=57926 RepID=UPI0021767810|nr:uncharacterized protein LOC126802288 [Potentilla anserina]
MDKFSRRTALLLFWFIIVSLQIPKTIAEEGQQNEEEQTYITRTLSVLQDTVSMLQKSHQAAWDKMKTTISDMQMQFMPPSLEADDKKDETEEGAGEKMKDAAQKSFETSKHTVEESAKTAADAVHKTAEKVKEVVTNDESSAEL